MPLKRQPRSSTILTLALLGGMLLLSQLTGCAAVSKKAPSIAHTHIGHALTGWRTTPDKEGLLVTAEKEAEIALKNAEQAIQASNSIDQIQQSIANVLHAVAPEEQPNGPGLNFGFERATKEAYSHLRFSSESEDASANVVRTVLKLEPKVKQILGRCGQIKEFAQAVKTSTSLEEASALAAEIHTLMQLNKVGSQDSGNQYGIAQFRADIEAMTQREEPPYRTVDSWYLFNLIRLPSGKWTFGESGASGSGDYDPSLSY